MPRIRVHLVGGPTHELDLRDGPLLLGRRAGVDVPLPHPTLAGVHARLEPTQDGLTLVDLGASPTTRVNDQPLVPRTPRLLAPDDTITIGPFELTLLPSPPDATPATDGDTAALAEAMVKGVLAALGDRGAAPPTLVITAGPAQGRRIPLDTPGRELVVGRGETCDLTLDDPDLSREHFRLRREWSGVTLADLGSKNGTRLDGVRLSPSTFATLHHHSKIQAGGTTIILEDPTSAASPKPEPEPEPEPVHSPPPPPPRPADPMTRLTALFSPRVSLLRASLALLVVALAALLLWTLLSS